MKIDIKALEARVRELVEGGNLEEAENLVQAVEAYYRGLLDAHMTRLSRVLAETRGQVAREVAKSSLLECTTRWHETMGGLGAVRDHEVQDDEAVALTEKGRV